MQADMSTTTKTETNHWTKAEVKQKVVANLKSGLIKQKFQNYVHTTLL